MARRRVRRKRRVWLVRATYPTAGRKAYAWGELDDKLRNAARRQISGTGTTLCAYERPRDVDFVASTERGATGVAKRLRALRLPGVLVEVRLLS